MTAETPLGAPAPANHALLNDESLRAMLAERDLLTLDGQGRWAIIGLDHAESAQYLRYLCGYGGPQWWSADNVRRFGQLAQRHKGALRRRASTAREPRAPRTEPCAGGGVNAGGPGVPDAVAAVAARHGGRLLYAWRLHLGLTQAEVAARMGITQSTYAVMESRASGRHRRQTLLRLAVALGLSLRQLGA